MSKTLKEDLVQQHEEFKAKAKNMGPVKLTVLFVLVVATVLSFVFYDYIFGADTVFTKQYDSEFLTAVMGLVPKVVSSVQVIAIVLVIATVVLFIIRHIFTKTRRSVTIGRLICNLLRWIIGIVLVIVVLAIWGVNTTALITGAGVVTLVVGLGMQSLIADVVAGLFIVFENVFNVGDIITVNGFRGEVINMGIRTTQLKALGNIKTFNNSELRAVLNQTKESSVAIATIDIEYSSSLQKVESIIKEKLPSIVIEGVEGEVIYDGVSALGASGVTLQFEANCYEGDIFAVSRRMNAALKNMFDENGIEIPFNQIVVHNAKK